MRLLHWQVNPLSWHHLGSPYKCATQPQGVYGLGKEILQTNSKKNPNNVTFKVCKVDKQEFTGETQASNKQTHEKMLKFVREH